MKRNIFAPKFLIYTMGCIIAIALMVITLYIKYINNNYKYKTIEKNYAPSELISNTYYYDEFTDGEWYEGELIRTGERSVGYGIKAVEYKGKLYKSKRW